MLVRYEYECFDRDGILIVKGSFEGRVDRAYSIRSLEVATRGRFAVLEYLHDVCNDNFGPNRMSKATILATNVHTGKSVYI